jgi:hypothetical protein
MSTSGIEQLGTKALELDLKAGKKQNERKLYRAQRE